MGFLKQGGVGCTGGSDDFYIRRALYRAEYDTSCTDKGKDIYEEALYTLKTGGYSVTVSLNGSTQQIAQEAIVF